MSGSVTVVDVPVLEKTAKTQHSWDADSASSAQTVNMTKTAVSHARMTHGAKKMNWKTGLSS